MLSTAETMRQNIQQLRSRLASQADRMAEIADRRKELAYTAEVKPTVTKDADAYRIAMAEHANAKNELHFLDAEKTQLSHQSETTSIALAQALVAYNSLDTDTLDKAERRDAEHARQLAEAFGKRGALIDAACATILRESKGILDDAVALDAFGYLIGSVNLVQVNVRRALEAGLAGSGLELHLVAPSARKTMASLTEGWATNVTAKADERLSKPKHTTKKAA